MSVLLSTMLVLVLGTLFQKRIFFLLFWETVPSK